MCDTILNVVGERSEIWVWEIWVSSSIHSGPLVDNCSMRQSQGNFLDAGHPFHNLLGFRLKLLQEVATFRTWNRTIRIARFRIARFSIQNRRFSATKGLPRGVSGPFGPRASERPKSVPRVSPECQKGVWTLPGHSRDTPGTLSGHSGGWGPKGPKNTLRDTPGTLRARRARETPVAGRGGCKTI